MFNFLVVPIGTSQVTTVLGMSLINANIRGMSDGIKWQRLSEKKGKSDLGSLACLLVWAVGSSAVQEE